jgi:hypothetical protein
MQHGGMLGIWNTGAQFLTSAVDRGECRLIAPVALTPGYTARYLLHRSLDRSHKLSWRWEEKSIGLPEIRKPFVQSLLQFSFTFSNFPSAECASAALKFVTLFLQTFISI